MSCEECDKLNEGQEGVAYYRWKTANIGFMGCRKHIKEIFVELNKIQSKMI